MYIKKLILIIIISNILFLTGCVDQENNKYDLYVGIDSNNHFPSIQNAIDNATNGDSIFVYNGIYDEKIIIDKSITIIGESNKSTIINYNANTEENINIISILSDNCTIDNLNITNENMINNLNGIVIKSSNNTIINTSISKTEKGIFIDSDYNKNSINNSIMNNNISNNNYGLHVTYSNNNIIKNNFVYANKEYGVYLLNSDKNILSYNFYKNNNYAIRIKGSRHNELYNNHIILNEKGLYFCCGARENIVYNNTFQDNVNWNANDALGNKWDNGFYGNYWGDYEEKYPNSIAENGIWQTPYNITGGKYRDKYPLVNPN